MTLWILVAGSAEPCLEAPQLRAGQVEPLQVAAAGEAQGLQGLAPQAGPAQPPIAAHNQRPACMPAAALSPEAQHAIRTC